MAYWTVTLAAVIMAAIVIPGMHFAAVILSAVTLAAVIMAEMDLAHAPQFGSKFVIKKFIKIIYNTKGFENKCNSAIPATIRVPAYPLEEARLGQRSWQWRCAVILGACHLSAACWKARDEASRAVLEGKVVVTIRGSLRVIHGWGSKWLRDPATLDNLGSSATIPR
eukprot:269292-Pelagomonas_calceolata.AAC.8